MLLTYESDEQIFIARSQYHEKDIVKSAGGFRWHSTKKYWWTKFLDGPLNLIDYLDESATKHLISMTGENIEKLQASTMADSDFEVPAPEGLKYRPFQRAGVAFIEKTNGRTLVGDEMGLGKTIEALGYCNLHPEFKKILVICPASLKANWRREAQKWLIHDTKMLIMEGSFYGRIDKDPDVRQMVIVNYDVLHRREDLLQDWDLVIADECHKIKNPKAKRTKAFLDICIPADHVVALTGTPILNRPLELWNIIHLLDPKAWEHLRAFKNRYCWDDDTGTYNGKRNLEELQEKLRTSVMIRRFKSQVLAELPDKQYTVIEVESDANVKMLEEQIMTFIDRDALDTLLHADKEDSKTKSMTFFNIFGEQQPFELISKFRHAAAIAKLSTVIEYTQELLEDADKVIVFAHHKVIQQALLQKFPDAAYIRGGMPNDERQAQVDKFQEDPNCHVFIGSLKAASEGITLTAASQVVMAEIDWTPAAMQQAEDRAHRIGQRDMVNIHMLITGGIEGWIAQLVAEKEEIIEASVGANSDAMDPRLDELKKKMQSLHGHLGKAKDIALEQSRQDAEQAKVRKHKMAAAYAEAGITDKKMETAQEMCRYLSSVCDGAAAEDGTGFNKFDSQFGKSLAGKDFWTVKMYLSVTKMMRKYKGQLPAHQYEVVYGG